MVGDKEGIPAVLGRHFSELSPMKNRANILILNDLRSFVGTR